MPTNLTPTPSSLIVVSNRGPSLDATTSGTSAAHAGGGLVATLAPALVGSGAVWIQAQSGDRDSPMVELHGMFLEHVSIPPATYRMYYDVVANSTLWFLQHDLLDLVRRPLFDRRWLEAWNAYIHVNNLFASRIEQAAAEGANVIVHDYHLALVGRLLSERRPDLRTVHFHHTPFADPMSFSVLPDDVAETILDGLSGYGARGFHTHRWANNFVACCRRFIDAEPTTFVSPASPDAHDLSEIASGTECRQKRQRLVDAANGTKLIVRVDRMEPSKNILRGFSAYDDLLQQRPDLHEKVTFAAFLNPSRQRLAEYLAYRNEVETLVRNINEKWHTAVWTPILLYTDDDYVQAIAALTAYDVLLVNPIRDGLNLVAKEAAVVNEHNGVLILSRFAGSWDELAHTALGVNPYDTVATSDALSHALDMSYEERCELAAEARRRVTMRGPRDWLSDLLAAVE